MHLVTHLMGPTRTHMWPPVWSASHANMLTPKSHLGIALTHVHSTGTHMSRRPTHRSRSLAHVIAVLIVVWLRICSVWMIRMHLTSLLIRSTRMVVRLIGELTIIWLTHSTVLTAWKGTPASHDILRNHVPGVRGHHRTTGMLHHHRLTLRRLLMVELG